MRLRTLMVLVLLGGCSSGSVSVQSDQQVASDLATDQNPGSDASIGDVADVGELSDLGQADLVGDQLDDSDEPLDGGDSKMLDLLPPTDLVVVPTCNPNAVYLKDGAFYRGKKPFPIMKMNYIVDIRREVVDGQDTYYLAPHHAFCADNLCCMSKQACLDALRADLQTIAGMGFNSVRILGPTIQPESGNLVVPCLTNVLPDQLASCDSLVVQTLNGEGPWRTFLFEIIEQMLEEMGKVNLNGLLHSGHHTLAAGNNPTLYKDYLGALAARFKTHGRLIGFDLWNEPSYQQETKLTKQQTHALVRTWYDAIRAQSNQLLVTVGLIDADTVFDWDPALLPLDFVSYHVYPHGEFSGARQATYEQNYKWFSTVKKTWIIGETGFAVQDWGDETMQATFAKRALELTRDCGGQGLSWWVYQDLHWGSMEHFGLLRWDETQRPAAALFNTFDWSGLGKCPIPSGYFNPDGHTAFTVEGRVVDSTGKPIPNARIRGWRCPDWGGSIFVTYSAADGTFKLSSDVGLVHVQITAAGMSVDQGIWPTCPSTQSSTIVGDRTLEVLTLDTSVTTPQICPPLPK